MWPIISREAMKVNRPIMEQIPIGDAIPPKPGTVLLTVSVGQWSALHGEAYRRGHTLLELDENERPVAAYRKRVECLLA